VFGCLYPEKLIGTIRRHTGYSFNEKLDVRLETCRIIF
jgi:hypothetical protein